MKKFVVLSFVSLLILAFGSIVYGQEKAPVLEFKTSGFIDAQTFWQKNATQANAAAGIYQTYAYNSAANRPALDDGNVAFLESRARLKFDAIMGPNLSGTFFFEFDSQPWGNASVGTRNSYGYWGGDRASLEIKNIYLTFGVPIIPVPMQLRIGEQGFAIRPNLLVSTDGIGITWETKIDPVVIQLLYGKIYENQVWAADDNDMYGGHVRANISTFTAGAYWLFYHMNTYPTDQGTAGNTGPSNGYAELHWWGGYLDGKVGPVTLNLDFIYDHGFEAERNGPFDSYVPKTRSVKYDGWLLHGKADFAIEKANIGLLGYYATGADAEQTNSFGLSSGQGGVTARGTPARRVGSFVIPTSSESGAAYGESAVFYSFWLTRGDAGIANNINYTQSARGGLGGTWMAKIYASYKIFPDFKLTGQAMYIRDTTKNGNTFGNARADNYTAAAPHVKDYSYIGTEADIIAEWQLYKNLKFSAAYGYMWAGSAMKVWNVSTGRNHMIQNPYGLYTNLTYSF
jgi:hypothetical protein